MPPEWSEIIARNIPIVSKLALADDPRFIDALAIILAEKLFVGCNGLEIDDEVRVTIAAQAAVLLVGHPGEYFPAVERILVYPSTFWNPRNERRDRRLGEASQYGFVVLSWDSVLGGSQNERDGGNTVLHEFAHMLDVEDFTFDGTPVLDTVEQHEAWVRVFSTEFRKLKQADAKGHDTALDPYGLTNSAEFFAVATEAFFERSETLAEEFPDLYEQLRRYYVQDPAKRGERTVIAGDREQESDEVVKGRLALRRIVGALFLLCSIAALIKSCTTP